MATKALITGISGQDGSYLAELLLEKGYEVHGMVRRSSSRGSRGGQLEQSSGPFFLHYGDLGDSPSINRLIREITPDEIYNLAAQTHVRVSFELPEFTSDTTGLGTLRVLEAIRESGRALRLFQASSAEMFGSVSETPQTERTPFYPRSPYAIAKLYSYWMTVNYREAYGMFISNGILFNHESPRRGENFVTRKISRGVAAIKYGFQTKLTLGNLDAKRDWGYAKEYVEAMWSMLQTQHPGDYVIATGKTHTVREFCQLAFDYVGLDWREHVVVDPQLFRPTEVDALLGDASKARRELGWEPKTDFASLVKLMVDAEMRLLGA